jgi:DNA-binding NtrC family response regulator
MDSNDKPYGLLYGSALCMKRLFDQIEKVSRTLATALIIGESGTGKELVANTIHQKSRRADGPFIPVNCGAIPDNLIETALFGHEKGSFTGASQQRIGHFEHACGGTIFLDEVTEMSLGMQVKLLRVLETGRFHRVGGTEQISVDVRIIAATNRDPQTAVKAGLLREDLMYRLAVFPLRVPPLRERGKDIPLLAEHFLMQFNRNAKTPKQFSAAAQEALNEWTWPGNIRELKNTIHRGWIMAEVLIELEDLGKTEAARKPRWVNGALSIPVGTSLAEAQKEIILGTFQHFGEDKELTAATLGINLKTLYNRLDIYRKVGEQ